MAYAVKYVLRDRHMIGVIVANGNGSLLSATALSMTEPDKCAFSVQGPDQQRMSFKTWCEVHNLIEAPYDA
jgi:hypothetical protein